MKGKAAERICPASSESRSCSAARLRWRRGGRAQPTVGNAETSLEQHRDKAYRPKGDVGAVTNGHKVAVS